MTMTTKPQADFVPALLEYRQNNGTTATNDMVEYGWLDTIDAITAACSPGTATQAMLYTLRDNLAASLLEVLATPEAPVE